jgi:large subunit ribosomal protein L16
MEWKPRKVKYKRLHKGRIYPLSYQHKNTSLKFGYYGLKILKDSRLTSKQLEASRRMISRGVRKKEKMWIRCIPNISFTRKPLGIRMGKGKGLVDERNNWIYRLQAGKVLFEVGFMSKTKAKKLLLAASKKLPVSSIIIYRPTNIYASIR